MEKAIFAIIVFGGIFFSPFANAEVNCTSSTPNEKCADWTVTYYYTVSPLSGLPVFTGMHCVSGGDKKCQLPAPEPIGD